MEYEQQHVVRGTDEIGVQRYPWPADPASPLVILWPAMGVPARYYRPFAQQLAERGLAVAVTDLRGTGASTPAPSRRSRYGYAELAGDVAAVLEALKPERDGRRTILLGHSLGGHACVMHLALTGDTTVDGLALVACGVPYWRVYGGPRGAAVLPYTQGISAVAGLLGVWPGWGFGGRQARGVIRDWAHSARTGRYPMLDGVDVEAAVAGIRTPVLAVSVEPDQYTPDPTVNLLCAKFSAAPVERARYTTAEAGAPLDHFRWVRAADPLAERIAAFARG